MEDILNIIGKKNTINGKFNINIDEDFREKPFTITADGKYFKSKNINVELSSSLNVNALYSAELESISIWLIADNTILFKKINKDKLKTDDTYKEIISKLLKINSTFKYITYIINENRQIFIFHEGKKDEVETLVNTSDTGFKNITEDFQNNSLLYELNNRIKKL